MSESVRFTDVEQHQFENYRPTNVLAITALAIALFSWVALIHPLLTVVAAVPMLLAALALLPSRAEAWGRPFALVALGLAILFASWGNTWYFYRRHVIFRQARQNGEYWLGLMADRQYPEAHQLSKSHAERAAPGTSLAEYYDAQNPGHEHDHDHDHQQQPGYDIGGSASPAELLASFMGKFPIDRLVETGDFEWRFEMVDAFAKEDYGAMEIGLRYRIFPKTDAESFNVTLVAVRIVENDIAYWHIDNVGGVRELTY